ncbi:hypothetical protein [Paraburkholderia sp. BR14374]|uniref:hypothetical protein n=1 Tax=Paraburkholderia sp. BR14374 TaxID=3237007 RepID=UPI0034CDD901
MDPQMNVLYLGSTGHVLAVFTRVAEPAIPEQVPDTFVGDGGLHVRGLGYGIAAPDLAHFNAQDIIVPTTQLKLRQTSLDPTVMQSPRQYTYDATGDKFSGIGPMPTLSPANPTTSITVTLLASPGKALNVLVFLQGPQPGASLLVPGPANTSNAVTTIQLPSLSPGEYDALLFVEGYKPAFEHFTVT